MRSQRRSELAAVEPKLVVCLGATTAQALLGRSARVGALRGKAVELEQGPALVTIHPSAVLRAGEEPTCAALSCSKTYTWPTRTLAGIHRRSR